jgi:class 3 adenylate cyclase/tetratricopeptide (TPR) repeat protein
LDRFVEELPLVSTAATLAFVDVAESVRLVCDDERSAVQRIRALLAQAARSEVPRHHGTLIERAGDGLLLRFEQPRHAVRCAQALHRLAAADPAARAGEPALRLRIGLHRGELLTDRAAVYGVGVNLAARIAAFSLPGDTVVSAAVRDQLTPGLDPEVQDLGECFLKHFDAPVRLFKLLGGPADLPADLQTAIAARLRLRPTLVILPTQAVADPGGPAPAAQPIGWPDIVSDQLCRQFSRSPLLHVISALSAQALRGREIDLGHLYRHWHADYVLHSRLAGQPDAGAPTGRITLSVELWRAGAGEPVHRQVASGRANDLLEPTSELLGAVVHAVGSRILAVEQRAAGAAAILPNLASHTLYLNAVDLLHRFSVPDFERARALLTALAERAPRHAEPLAWLARWHVFRVVQGWTDDHRRDSLQALSYSQQALDRDPQSALALTMAGSVQAGVNRDPQAAQRCYAQALQSNPNDSLAWLMSGVAHGFLSSGTQALAASEFALGLAPIDPTRHYYDSLAASASVMAGEYSRGIALARRSIQANATHGSAYRAMATAQVMLGRLDDARLTVGRLLAVEPHCTVQTYLSRVGPASTQNLRFAEALRSAGLPEN